MKKKIVYIILAILLIVDIVITKQIGLKVNLYYAEGYTVTFKEKDTIELNEVKEIAKQQAEQIINEIKKKMVIFPLFLK